MSALDNLQRKIMKDIEKSMRVISEKALADLYEETAGFYAGTTPEMYERTGALGDTPRTTALNIGSKSVSFDAYLDRNYVYDTGKEPTMEDVLDLANSDDRMSSVGYLAPTIGHEGFWERAEKKIEHDINDVMRKSFR